jgi:hypothetical protein
MEEWTALWRYAVALTVPTKKLQANLQAHGLPVMVIAGEPQVRRTDIERFIEERRHEAQVRASKPTAPDAPASRPGAVKPISAKLEQQAAELETLKRQVAELLAARGAA